MIVFDLYHLHTCVQNIKEDLSVFNESFKTLIPDQVGRSLAKVALGDKTLADAAVSYNSGKIYFNKLLVVQRCDYFRTLLSSRWNNVERDEDGMPLLSISGAEHTTLRCILRFLFTDHCDASSFSMSTCKKVLVSSQFLGLPRLVSLVEIKIAKLFDVSIAHSIQGGTHSAIDMLDFACTHQATQLENFFLHFIATNYDCVKKKAGESWNLLTDAHLETVNANRWPPADYWDKVRDYELRLLVWEKRNDKKKKIGFMPFLKKMLQHPS